VILVLTAGGALAVYLLTVHKVASPWKVAGANIQDVSRATGIQTEVSVAVDPSNPRVLFAASNESLEPEIRIYTSRNGGRTWTTGTGPAFNPNTCAWGDPAVAIAPGGRQYVAFTEKSVCIKGPDLSPYLVVAARSGPGRAWVVRRVTRPAIRFGFDDKPAIAVGSDGRVYVAWSRLLQPKYQTTVTSFTADDGRTWSPPRVVDSNLVQPQFVSLAGGRQRTVYIAGVDARFGIWIGRSTDGGRRFAVRQAAQLPGNRAATCIVFGKYVLAQQAVRCLGPDPVITVAKGRVFLTYAAPGPDQTQDVHAVVFDSTLRRLWQGPVGAGEKKKSDQFWPVSAVDAGNGHLWVCFYDTSGDSKRGRAWFTCTISPDGRRWSTPVRAAHASADVGVLVQDAQIYGFGDSGGYGGYAGLAVADGTAHPMWIDTRDVGGNQEEVFGARVPAKAFTARD